MDIVNVAFSVFGICVITIMVFVTVLLCSGIYISIKDMFKQYKNDKKNPIKEIFEIND